MIRDKIAVLGSGVTAKSVLDFANRCQIEVVSVTDATLIIASPGLNPDSYPETTTPIISDIEWAYRLFQASENPPKLIGVTGTNGKSTVTAMISHVCDIPYAGNIGVPLLNYVGLEDEFPCIVVELSSYQLETCFDFRPDIAVILNISPDHLGRHKTMDAYSHEKKKCFINQHSDDVLIFNADDTRVVDMVRGAKATKVSFSNKDITDSFTLIKSLVGRHNYLNASIALTVASYLNLDQDVAFRSLHSFKPLKHRLEFVCEVNGINIYNDSKATNPESTMVGIHAFNEAVVLICCGDDKGLAFDALVDCIGKHVSSLIIFGGIASRLGAMVSQSYPDCVVVYVETLKDAIVQGIKQANEKEVLLFSPASSSFDCFNGYEDRGNQFVDGVNRYVEAALV